LAVDKNGRCRALARARQTDPDVGVLALARAVDDAAHDRDVEALDPGVALLPDRHLSPEKTLDAIGQLLEVGAGGPAAARAGGNLGRELPQAQALQDLLADHHLLGARLAGPRRERGPDRVADPLLEQERERGAGRDDALGADPGLGPALASAETTRASRSTSSADFGSGSFALSSIIRVARS
jgi:hypothetical protein